jgi:molybdopterin-guanine dinucleotide biosynthesis protein A
VSADGLAAAILVGGQSRRMGTNKALLRLEPGGPAVVEMVLQTLQQVADQVVLVGHDLAAYSFLNLPWLHDDRPQAGPLAGIHAAMLGVRTDHVLVVACDMPFLNVDLLRFMVNRPRTYDVLVPEIGQLQPLHAIYTQSCQPTIERYLATGRRRVTGWFAKANVQIIPQAEVERFDPTLRSCFNLNTPADLDRARKMS